METCGSPVGFFMVLEINFFDCFLCNNSLQHRFSFDEIWKYIWLLAIISILFLFYFFE